MLGVKFSSTILKQNYSLGILNAYFFISLKTITTHKIGLCIAMMQETECSGSLRRCEINFLRDDTEILEHGTKQLCVILFPRPAFCLPRKSKQQRFHLLRHAEGCVSGCIFKLLSSCTPFEIRSAFSS